jgi:hypothetical protein
MHRLATDVWSNQQRVTRIDWCINACREYFLKAGLQQVRDKAQRRQTYDIARSPCSQQVELTLSDCKCLEMEDNTLSSSACQRNFEGCGNKAAHIPVRSENADTAYFDCKLSVEGIHAESTDIHLQTVSGAPDQM